MHTNAVKSHTGQGVHLLPDIACLESPTGLALDKQLTLVIFLFSLADCQAQANGRELGYQPFICSFFLCRGYSFQLGVRHACMCICVCVLCESVNATDTAVLRCRCVRMVMLYQPLTSAYFLWIRRDCSARFISEGISPMHTGSWYESFYDFLLAS